MTLRIVQSDGSVTPSLGTEAKRDRLLSSARLIAFERYLASRGAIQSQYSLDPLRGGAFGAENSNTNENPAGQVLTLWPNNVSAPSVGPWKQGR
jgi:hypothetical protein